MGMESAPEQHGSGQGRKGPLSKESIHRKIKKESTKMKTTTAHIPTSQNQPY